jgi:CubicO group peptidase (beta-lactamase class C family)
VTAASAVSGTVAPGFEGVRAAFERNAETGGAFAAMVDGEPVADLWGGIADPETGRPWGERTCAVVFSGTKGIVATALLLLAGRGQLDLDAPVTSVWPEFAAAGKSSVTLAQLFSHCGGVPGLDTPFELGEPAAMARALAAQAPIVPVGAPSYHAYTYGWLADAVIRRVDGRSAGAFVRDELARDLDLRIGLAPDDELASERAQLRLGPSFALGAFSAPDPDPRLELVYGTSLLTPAVWNDPAVLSYGVPAVGGVATARALATLYDRIRSLGLSPGVLTRAWSPAGVGDDPLTGRPLRFGPTGYELAGTLSALGPEPNAFGHTGAGGSSHGCWPSRRTSWSYVMAELRSEGDDQRARSLLAALHEAVTRS